jgi:hypothetical protein
VALFHGFVPNVRGSLATQGDKGQIDRHFIFSGAMFRFASLDSAPAERAAAA